jgi:hypothetical protein
MELGAALPSGCCRVREMAAYAYQVVTVNHQAREVNVGDGGVPRDIDGGYFQLSSLFNTLGADGWLLCSSVHEQIEGIGSFTLHVFAREV